MGSPPTRCARPLKGASPQARRSRILGLRWVAAGGRESFVGMEVRG